MFCPSHYKFVEAFKHKVGKELKTCEIEEIMSPRFIIKKGGVRPNAHSNVVNPSSCACANTNERIFDKIKHGTYRVR